jgi:LEA14-like dessication related protein
VNKKVLIGLGVLALAGGGYLYVSKQVQNAYKLEYIPKDYRLVSLNKGTLNATLFLEVKNPTDLEAVIKRYNFVVSLNGHKVADVKSKSGFDLKPFSSKVIEVDIKANLKQVLGSTGAAMMLTPDFKNLIINLKGSLGVNKFGLPISIPLDIDIRLGDFMDE